MTYDEVLRRAKDVRDILPLYDVATGAMVIAVLGARGEPDHAFRIPVELAAEFRAIMLEEMYRRAN